MTLKNKFLFTMLFGLSLSITSSIAYAEEVVIPELKTGSTDITTVELVETEKVKHKGTDGSQVNNKALIKRAINAKMFLEHTKDDSSNLVTAAAASTDPVAILTVFSDDTPLASSFADIVPGHAFITVRNISTQNIQVGKFNNIAPNADMSVGTWGNKEAHTGLWYNLEENAIALVDAYQNRASISYVLTQAELNTLNMLIVYNDIWTLNQNCAWFASAVWNYIIPDIPLNIPAVLPTPSELKQSILALSPNWNMPTSWWYAVYHANGTGAATYIGSYPTSFWQ